MLRSPKCAKHHIDTSILI